MVGGDKMQWRLGGNDGKVVAAIDWRDVGGEGLDGSVDQAHGILIFIDLYRKRVPAVSHWDTCPWPHINGDVNMGVEGDSAESGGGVSGSVNL